MAAIQSYTIPIFSFIAAVAFLGNVLVLYVLFRKSHYLKQPYNIFILNLVITDLLTAIVLLFSKFVYNPGMPDGDQLSQEIYCRAVSRPNLVFIFGYISVYNCLALTVERWLAVVKPQMYRSVKASHAVIAIAGVWTWGVAVNLRKFFTVKMNHSAGKCTPISLGFADKEVPYLDFVFQSVIPFALIVVLYVHIHRTMAKLPNVGSRTMKKVTLLAFTASAVLILGWMPGRIRIFLIKTGAIENHKNGYFAQYCLAVLALCNSCINPFLYGMCCAHFKKEYTAIFKKIFSPGKCSGRAFSTTVTVQAIDTARL